MSLAQQIQYYFIEVRKFTITMSAFVMIERLDPLTCRCLEEITFFLSTCHP